MLQWPSPEELTDYLAELQRRDPTRRWFGSSGHRYRLGPCARIEAVEESERTIGVSLPEEYRDFVLRYGDGGAGPGYGIIPINRAIAYCQPDGGAIGQPFVPAASAHAMDEDRAFPDAGLLPLAEMGCGWDCVLVIAGPERGTIWQFVNDYEPTSRGAPVYPPSATAEDRAACNARYTNELLADCSRRLTFRQCYLDWLERALLENSPDGPSLTERVKVVSETCY